MFSRYVHFEEGLVQHAPHEFMHDNEVLPRPHPCHGFLGRIFMLSSDTASGTAPSGQDLSAKSTHRATALTATGTHQATAPHGKEQARGEGHYVTASKSKLVSMQPQYAVHPGTGPFRRAAISHAYRILQAVRSQNLMHAYADIMAAISTYKQGLPQGWQSRPLARYGKYL